MVRAKFVETLDALLESGSYVAIPTHDHLLIDRSLERLRGVPAGRYEFQMLLGVRPELGDRLVDQGHRLRVYVPFGRRWYEYWCSARSRRCTGSATSTRRSNGRTRSSSDSQPRSLPRTSRRPRSEDCIIDITNAVTTPRQANTQMSTDPDRDFELEEFIPHPLSTVRVSAIVLPLLESSNRLVAEYLVDPSHD